MDHEGFLALVRYNADGLVPGNRFGGGNYGNYSHNGHAFPFASLVGSLDGGKSFFLVGTQYEKVVAEPGRLSLCFWDVNNVDNKGSVRVAVGPSVTTHEVKAKDNSVSGGVPLNTGVTLSKGDGLKITVPPAHKWSNSLCGLLTNADGKLNNFTPNGRFSKSGHTFVVGSLVGSLDGGRTFFQVGTHYEQPAAESGQLLLCYWDSDSANNHGAVVATVSVCK